MILNATPLEEVAAIPGYPVVLTNTNDLIYLRENGVVDSSNNVHVIVSGTQKQFRSETEEDAPLYYSKIDKEGNKEINNKTISLHERKSNDDYYPSIYDPQIALDSEGNIHFAYHFCDGSGHHSIWYGKIDNNGNILIPPKQIAGEIRNEIGA